MERSPILTARICGNVVKWERVWHTRGEPISKAEHDYLVALHQWQREYAPDEPGAEPSKPIDPMQLPIPFAEDC